MSLFSLFESKLTLKRATIARDTAKGVTQSPFVTIAQDIPYSAQPASPSVQQIYAQRQAVVTTQIYLEQLINAQVNDYIDVQDSVTGVTTRYLVQGEAKRLTGRFSVPWVIDCQYLQTMTDDQ